MNKLSNFTIKSVRLEWSAFAGYFSQAQWQSVHAVWALMELWSAWGWLCVAVQLRGVELRYICCEFPFILAHFET